MPAAVTEINNRYYLELQSRLKGSLDLENRIDAFRIFKAEKDRIIQGEFLEGNWGLERTMSELTALADGILISACELATAELRSHYGIPSYRDKDGNYLRSEIALIGMGKLGGRELHFHSDLDLIFVFSRNGDTQGAKPITNQEYFSKLGQRIISYLTLHTRYGYVYKVDTELRPSGNAGTLVTCLDTWIAYYHEHAALWEKQALLKARLLYATGSFHKEFKGLFPRLIFQKPFGEKSAQEIHRLRMRIEKELAKEGPRRLHLKKGPGGLVDIEFVIQYLQLKLGKIFDHVLHANTLLALDRLLQSGVLTADSHRTLKEAYEFYRLLEFHLELHLKLKEGFLDPEHDSLGEVVDRMGLKSKNELLERLANHRGLVREIYLKTLHIEKG